MLLDNLLPKAHGARRRRHAGVALGDVRDRGRCWPTCCAAWTSCATRPRWSGTASTRPTRRSTRCTTTTAPRCCWPRCTGRACAAWCWRRRWSCTARAATRARRTAIVRPGPRRQSDVDAGRFEPPCPVCGAALSSPAGARGRPDRPAQHVRGDEGRAGVPGLGVGAADRRRRVGAALPQRLRPTDAKRHPVCGRRVAVPLGAPARRGTDGPGGRPPATGLRPRDATWRWPTRWPWTTAASRAR